jgi:hypothetical protein
VDTDVGGAVQSKHFHADHDTRCQRRSRLHGWSRAGDLMTQSGSSTRQGCGGAVRGRTGRGLLVAYPARVADAACRAHVGSR